MSADAKPARPAADSAAPAFSPGGEIYDIAQPIRVSNLSIGAGWRSILVRAMEIPMVADPIDFPVNHDQMVAVCVDGECEAESFAGGAWRKGYYRRGVSGLTPAGKTDTLRFRPVTAPATRFLQICIPRPYFAAAEEQLRGRGARFRDDHPLNALCVRDPLVFQTAVALDDAMREGAPNLYAEAASQLLAVHLLARQRGRSAEGADAAPATAITDRRLARVRELVDQRFAEDLSLADLAGEAGISPYHFIRAFKSASGTTPYRYLIAARMRAAAAFLRDSDLGIKEIAARCGYANAENFRVAFRKHFRASPGAYRRMAAASRR